MANFLMALKVLILEFATIYSRKCGLPLMACQKIFRSFVREQSVFLPLCSVLTAAFMWQCGKIMRQTVSAPDFRPFFAISSFSSHRTQRNRKPPLLHFIPPLNLPLAVLCGKTARLYGKAQSWARRGRRRGAASQRLGVCPIRSGVTGRSSPELRTRCWRVLDVRMRSSS